MAEPSLYDEAYLASLRQYDTASAPPLPELLNDPKFQSADPDTKAETLGIWRAAFAGDVDNAAKRGELKPDEYRALIDDGMTAFEDALIGVGSAKYTNMVNDTRANRELARIQAAENRVPDSFLGQVGQEALAFTGSVMKGAGSAVTGITDALAIGYGLATDQDPEELALYQWGENTMQYWDNLIPDRVADGFFANLGQALGSGLGFIGAGGALGKAGAGFGKGVQAIQNLRKAAVVADAAVDTTAVAATTAARGGLIAKGGKYVLDTIKNNPHIALLGGTINFSGNYREARDMGYTENEALIRGGVGFGLGMSEAIGLGSQLTRIDKITGGKFKNLLTWYAREAFEEGAQEAGQTLATGMFDLIYNNEKNKQEFGQIIKDSIEGGSYAALSAVMLGTFGGIQNYKARVEYKQAMDEYRQYAVKNPDSAEGIAVQMATTADKLEKDDPEAAAMLRNNITQIEESVIADKAAARSDAEVVQLTEEGLVLSAEAKAEASSAEKVVAVVDPEGKISTDGSLGAVANALDSQIAAQADAQAALEEEAKRLQEGASVTQETTQETTQEGQVAPSKNPPAEPEAPADAPAPTPDTPPAGPAPAAAEPEGDPELSAETVAEIETKVTAAREAGILKSDVEATAYRQNLTVTAIEEARAATPNTPTPSAPKAEGKAAPEPTGSSGLIAGKGADVSPKTPSSPASENAASSEKATPAPDATQGEGSVADKPTGNSDSNTADVTKKADVTDPVKPTKDIAPQIATARAAAKAYPAADTPRLEAMEKAGLVAREEKDGVVKWKRSATPKAIRAWAASNPVGATPAPVAVPAPTPAPAPQTPPDEKQKPAAKKSKAKAKAEPVAEAAPETDPVSEDGFDGEESGTDTDVEVTDEELTDIPSTAASWIRATERGIQQMAGGRDLTEEEKTNVKKLYVIASKGQVSAIDADKARNKARDNALKFAGENQHFATSKGGLSLIRLLGGAKRDAAATSTGRAILDKRKQSEIVKNTLSGSASLADDVEALQEAEATFAIRTAEIFSEARKDPALADLADIEIATAIGLAQAVNIYEASSIKDAQQKAKQKGFKGKVTAVTRQNLANILNLTQTKRNDTSYEKIIRNPTIQSLLGRFENAVREKSGATVGRARTVGQATKAPRIESAATPAESGGVNSAPVIRGRTYRLGEAGEGIYSLSEDPDKLRPSLTAEGTGAMLTAWENAIAAAGYKGYVTPDGSVVIEFTETGDPRVIESLARQRSQPTVSVGVRASRARAAAQAILDNGGTEEEALSALLPAQRKDYEETKAMLGTNSLAEALLGVAKASSVAQPDKVLADALVQANRVVLDQAALQLNIWDGSEGAYTPGENRVSVSGIIGGRRAGSVLNHETIHFAAERHVEDFLNGRPVPENVAVALRNIQAIRVHGLANRDMTAPGSSVITQLAALPEGSVEERQEKRRIVSATMRSLAEAAKASNLTQEQRDAALAVFENVRAAYGFLSLSEFIADAMTYGGFQQTLDRISAEGLNLETPVSKPKTLWQAVKAAFKQLVLGRPITENSALGRAFDNVIDLLDAVSGQPAVGAPAVSGTRLSEETDVKYLAAVERGDMETAQRMVDEAAKGAGDLVFPVFLPREDSEQSSQYPKIELSASPYHLIGTHQGFALYEFKNQRKGGSKLKLLHLETGWTKAVPDKTTASLNASRYADSLRGIPPDYSGKDGWGNTKKFSWKQYDSGAVVSTREVVTRDEQGNVIPLSKRFDTANPDIRFSEETTDEDLLKLAEAFGEPEVRNSLETEVESDDPIYRFLRQALDAELQTYNVNQIAQWRRWAEAENRSLEDMDTIAAYSLRYAAATPRPTLEQIRERLPQRQDPVSRKLDQKWEVAMAELKTNGRLVTECP